MSSVSLIAQAKYMQGISSVGVLFILIEYMTTSTNGIRSYIHGTRLTGVVPPVLDAPSIINSNRIYAVGGDAWVIQNPRNYTPLTHKGTVWDNQSSGDKYSGSITATVLKSGTLAIVAPGKTTGRKIRMYSEGGLNIMGDTRIHGVVTGDSFPKPPDET